MLRCGPGARSLPTPSIAGLDATTDRRHDGVLAVWAGLAGVVLAEDCGSDGGGDGGGQFDVLRREVDDE